MSRGRRATHSREDVLAAGLILFNRQGYHATGMNEILQACKISRGSFYNFFASKEAFAIEIIEHYGQAQEALWHQHFSNSAGRHYDKISVMLEQEIESYLNADEKFGCLLANLSGELGLASDTFRKAIHEATEKVISNIAEDMALCQQEGSIRDDLAPRDIALLVWDAWQGALLRMKVESSIEPLRHKTRILCEHLLLRPTPRTGENHG